MRRRADAGCRCWSMRSAAEAEARASQALAVARRCGPLTGSANHRTAAANTIHHPDKRKARLNVRTPTPSAGHSLNVVGPTVSRRGLPPAYGNYGRRSFTRSPAFLTFALV